MASSRSSTIQPTSGLPRITSHGKPCARPASSSQRCPRTLARAFAIRARPCSSISPSARQSVESEAPSPNSAAWRRASSSTCRTLLAPSAIPTTSPTSASARSSIHGLVPSTPRSCATSPIRSAVRCSSTAPACPTRPFPDASTLSPRSQPLRFFTVKVPVLPARSSLDKQIIAGSGHLSSTRRQIPHPG